MKRVLCCLALMAGFAGGCAWYDIQPVPASSLNHWRQKDGLPEGYIFYQPELYFAVSAVTDVTGRTNKQSITVTPVWLPNYQKPYRLTTHNVLARADFTFTFENGWKLTQISDKGDNSTVANTLAGQLATVLKASGVPLKATGQVPETRVFLYRPTFNPTNGYFDGFEEINAVIKD